MNMEMSPAKKKYYPLFDYVRFFAASIVMFGHGGLIHWRHSGAIAVDVFFALSGWLIGGILLTRTVKDLPRFYFNRAIRIWGPYFLALSLIVLVSLIKDPITIKWFEIVAYKLTFVYNFFGPPQLAEFKSAMPLDGTGNHFWSVNAEEQFYLFSPLLLVVFYKFGRNPILWVLLSIITWKFNFYAPIFLGVLAAILVDKYGAFHRKFIFQIIWCLLLVISLIGFISGDDFRFYSPAFSVALILLLAIEGKVGTIGQFLGGISYPLYLNHWIGVFSAHVLFSPFGLRDSLFSMVVAVLLNYILASFLYTFIDKPFLANRDSLYSIQRGNLIIFIAYGTVALGITIGFVNFNN